MKKWFIVVIASTVVIFALIVIFSLNNHNQENAESGKLKFGCTPMNLSGEFDMNGKYAFFDSKKITIPKIAFLEKEVSVLGSSSENKWIEVDLSEQKMKAWEGDKLYLETLVSTGLPWYPTPTGEFRVWLKLRATKMEGGSGKYYYYLPNVPYVMFFENEKVPGWIGYGLHGTYWHDDFGTQRSHGCVNLPTNIAEQLFYWVSPELTNSKWSVRSTSDNPGTRIVIHE
ncbi:hypothetical protein A2Z22_01280 [Candidatus Woesebacteria bacterium RBG_16_34_12]|uniref:L,D-TPase catalytic domain-containing protein n=1 Tax=Candidatus Woesebacteria bacterium RBG_16_34_12 TaxID=1802480 RepID=A0A1F7XAJ2_9BACT|nr:MAG: hypothetical protein A2Z22_01280 [Candidatus Woesebacteria bacterium RBG_16_34_12]